MKNLFYIFLCIIFLYSCSGSSTSDIGTNKPPEFSTRSWLYTDDFDTNPKLHAQDSQTVIIEVDDRFLQKKSSSSQDRTVHTIPYYVKNDMDMTFSIDTESPCIESVKMTDSEGKEVFYRDLKNPSVKIKITSGSYNITIKEVYPLPQHCSLVFFYKKGNDDYLKAKNAKVGGSFDSGEGVYRAFQLLKITDSNKWSESYDRNGLLLALRDTVNVEIPWQSFNDKVVVSYWPSQSTVATLMGVKSTYINYYSQTGEPLKIGDVSNLMSLVPYGFTAEKVFKMYSKALGYNFPYQATLIAYSPSTGKDWLYQAKTAYWMEFQMGLYSGDLTIQQSFLDSRLDVFLASYWREGNKNRWTVYVESSYDNPSLSPYVFNLKFDTGSFGAHTLRFRGNNPSNPYDQSNLILTDLFIGRDSWHEPWIPGQYSYNLHLKEVYRYYEDAAKLKEIDSKEIAFYTGANYMGKAVVFNTDMLPLYRLDFSAFPVKSIRFGTIRDFTLKLMDNKGNRVEIGADVANLEFDGRFKNFGSITGISVYNAFEFAIGNDCPGCNLQDTNFSGRYLGGRNFRQTNFARADLSRTILINTDLTDAILQGARLDNANLQGVNMCRAFLNKDIVIQKAATLNGAYMKDANLSFADVSGVSFINTNFHSTIAKESCMPDINCKTKECSSAYKATMTNADFSGAYLSGADMSNATLTGSKFTNAFAIGVNFSNSNLYLDPLTGQSGAVFVGAYLFGANFSNARVQGVQFTNAYFDDQVNTPSSKGVAIVYLNPLYTSFPNSPFYQDYVCPQSITPMVTKAENLPTTDSTVTCPNGQAGRCVYDKWTALVPWDSSKFVINYKAPYQRPSQCASDRVYFLW